MAITLTSEAFPPGEYLRDELEERGWSAKEFAEILGRPAQAVSEILNGKKQIAPATALAIGEALGTSASLWMNLQTAFNLYEAQSRRPELTEIARRSRMRSIVPVAELRRREWLPDTEDLDTLERAVKDLLQIADIGDDPNFAIAARRSDPDASFSPQQTAWLARVRQVAEGRPIGAYDREMVTDLAVDLVHRIHDPTDLGGLEGWLSECGVVLVTALPLRSSKLDGAAMMLDNGNPVIGLTSRGDRMDGYVFTLLHELAHLILGHLDNGAIRVDEDIHGRHDVVGAEAEANRKAAAWILPEDLGIPAGRVSMMSILEMAKHYRVHASFVIGRLQHDRNSWGMFRTSIPRVRPFLVLS
jgi:HTH-type transcriptional regulator/antitoxin HigA